MKVVSVVRLLYSDKSTSKQMIVVSADKVFNGFTNYAEICLIELAERF